MKDWYYFYTPDYAFWYRHLQSTLGNHFSLHPVEIDPASLALNEGDGHHFKGCSIKLELVIDCISRNLGKTILFSDCTLVINKANTTSLKTYIDGSSGKFDIVFADNGVNEQVNIGFMLIRCNMRTLKFWLRILAIFQEDSWDQSLVNNALRDTGLGTSRTSRCPGITWSKFDKAKVVCGYRLDESHRDKFLLYKQFIHPSTKASNWNERLRSLNSFGLVSDEDLKANLIEESQAISPLGRRQLTGA